MPFTEGYNKLRSKASQILESVKNSEIFPSKKVESLPYAYPCDNYMDSILSNVLVRKTLQLFAEKYCKAQIENIRLNGQLVTADNYPRLYGILQGCYVSLNVGELPEVYITSQLKGINALSVGTDNAPIILISRKAVISLPDGELKFMVGHELGHIMQQNLMCHTINGLLDNLNSKSQILGPIVSDLVDVPLKQWYRCAEFTADRAGYICTSDMSHIESLFQRLCSTTMKESDPMARYFELSNIHPMYHCRLKELEKYISHQQ